jgi:hypothetical protein
VHEVVQWAGVGAVVAIVLGMGLSLMFTRARMISEEEVK